MFKRLILTIILLLINISLTGCFSSDPLDIKYFKMPHDVNTSTDTYVMQPPDEVEILCTKVPIIHERRQIIRPDGKISFEEFGEITAAGKTPSELAEDLRLKIEELYKLEGENSVDVRISIFKSKVYYVLGQVNDPGPRLYTGRETLLTAISLASPNPMAWLERIQVIRPSADEEIEPAIFELNYDRLMAHGDATKNVLLQEGDVIYVPPTVLGWMALKIEEFIRPIARAFEGSYIVRRGVDTDNRYY
ncbi:MAG: polysaccharide biosynthesis/export family protein [Sedimentisphaerales bacterium]|nr:polysaccharide biosynthesis/export family protein [Sedimentisphaerales bacterium]